eukprot:gene5892-6133_t
MAEFGGAIALVDASLRINDSVLNLNVATQYDGGALYIVASSNTSVVLADTIISSNRALFDGGACYARQIMIDFRGTSAGTALNVALTCSLKTTAGTQKNNKLVAARYYRILPPAQRWVQSSWWQFRVS